MRKSNFFGHKAVVATLLVAVSALVVGCCGACRGETREYKPLVATEWAAEQIQGRNVEAMVAQGERGPVLVLDNQGGVSGTGGCNSIGGQYKMVPSESKIQRNTAGTIEFGQMLATKRYCPNDRLEREFLKILSVVDSFVIEGDRLHLFHNGELVMVLRAKDAAPDK